MEGSSATDHGSAALFLPVAPFGRRLGQRRRFRVQRFELLGFLVREFIPRGQGLPCGLDCITDL
jgi:hypothetical protein